MEPEWDQQTQDRVWREYQRVVVQAHEDFPTQPGRLSELARQLQVPYAALASFICRRKKEQEMDWASSARRRVLVDEQGEAKMAELTEEVKEQLWQRYQADPGRRGLATELAAEYELDKKQVYNYLYNRKAKERSDNGRVRASGLMEGDLGAPSVWVSGGVPVASATITPDWNLADVVRELMALRQSTIALAEVVGLLIEAVRGL